MNIRESLNNLKKSIEKFAEDPDELFTDALCLGFDDNYSEAVKVLDEAIEASSKLRKKEALSLLWAVKAIALSKLNRDNEALDAIDKAVELDDKNGFNWSVKGDIHHDLDEQDKAFNAYQEALKNSEEDDDPDIIWDKADVLSHLGKHEDALNEYEKVIKLEPELATSWFGKSSELSELGETKKALESCERGLEIDRDDIDLVIHHGSLMMDLNRNEEALKSLNRATLLDSKEELGWYNKACALAKLDRKEEALDALTVAISIEPDNLDSMKDDKDLDNIRDTERFKRLQLTDV